jgi:hypothetical protein
MQSIWNSNNNNDNNNNLLAVCLEILLLCLTLLQLCPESSVTECIVDKPGISGQFYFRGNKEGYPPTAAKVSTCLDLHRYSLQRLREMFLRAVQSCQWKTDQWTLSFVEAWERGHWNVNLNTSRVRRWSVITCTRVWMA